MTRSEMDYLDSVLVGPALLFLNQYFNNFIQEYYVLWLCLVWLLLHIFWFCETTELRIFFLMALWQIWAAIDLYRYCHRVCLEICSALKIELFRIQPRVAVPAGATLAAQEFLASSTNGSRNGRHRAERRQ